MTDAIEAAAKPDFAENMKMLVLGMIRALVDQPDDVVVETIDQPKGTLLRVRVAPADIGKVIGKHGRTARSLRTILGAASVKEQHRYSLDITDGSFEEKGLRPGGAPGDAED